MKKYKKLILSGVFLLIVAMSFVLGRFSNTENEYLEDKPKQVKEKNLLSYYLENENGEYEAASGETWPTKGYKFNATLSKCENGGELGWDDTKKVITMTGNMSDKCYIYFDLYTFAKYIVNLYNEEGTVGTNIYYHNGTITSDDGTILDAQDNSYRYAGASDVVNNYVCFGSDEDTCPEDNLYRIIGVFGNQVKLIKSTSLGSMAWDSNNSNTWSTSSLNTYLNGEYLTNLQTTIGDTLYGKIADTTWKVGGVSSKSVTASEMYTNEMTSTTFGTDNATEYSAKIGLMYASDYGFTASPTAWSVTLDSYNGNDADGTSISTINWLYLETTEWIISRSPDKNYKSFILYKGAVHIETGTCFVVAGKVSPGCPDVSTSYIVRPTFYLNSGVTYVSGSGSSTDPIRIS